jgi:hypothetical protein
MSAPMVISAVLWVGQADPNLLPADHDRPAHGHAALHR